MPLLNWGDVKMVRLARYIGTSVVALALILPVSSAVEPYVEVVHDQLDAMVVQLDASAEEAGAKAVSLVTFEDLLASDTGHSYEVGTDAESSYAVVGACDSDCGDLDIIVSNAAGEAIAADETESDVPVILFDSEEAATYTLTANLYDCAADTCYYGVRLVQLQAD
jgi:NAD(P)-dependent dehydrogenase (short-subunit alcohol dehydrogenase family)